MYVQIASYQFQSVFDVVRISHQIVAAVPAER
jgi:hypothetical protein